jgi:hypothetical protein
MICFASPLLDPLNFNAGTGDANLAKYKALCNSTKPDWEGNMLKEFAQQRQEDWFGLWVGQMARIAKPGAPLIVENASPPFCAEMEDWGGVTKEWWSTAIDKYDWGLDPESIEFGEDHIQEHRYHVFMRKMETIVEEDEEVGEDEP